MFRSFLALVFVLSAIPADKVLGQASLSPQQPRPTSSTPIATESNPEAKTLYEEGVKRVEMGEISEAVERFQRAIKLDPEYADAYSALGRAFFKLRQWENASGNLRHAIALRAARERERQEILQKNRGRRIVGDTSPLVPDRKPEGLNNKLAEPKTTASVSVTVTQKSIPTTPAIKTGETVLLATSTQPRASSPSSTKSGPRTNTRTIDAGPIIPEPNPQLNKATAHQQELNATPVRTVEPAVLVNTTSDNLDNALPETISSVLVLTPPTVQLESVPLDPPPQAIAAVKSLSDISEGTLQEVNGTQPPPAESFRTESAEAQQPLVGADQLTVDDPEPLRPKLEQAEVQVAVNAAPALPTIASVSKNLSTDEVRLINTYRVGPRDVLDVHLNDYHSPQGTAFIVTSSGLLEHPKLSEALSVAGLTVEEIATKIEAELKKNAADSNPKAVVGVLDYVSHAIVVNGLVKDPGTKSLKREAIPLIVVLADAQPLPDAARVTVERNGVKEIETDLNRTADMNFLVHRGDIVTLQSGIAQTFYIDGRVKIPGEKTYRQGLTLTQAIITAGGVARESTVAEISRVDSEGTVVRTSFDLKLIELGKTADPLVKPGDRILILR